MATAFKELENHQFETIPLVANKNCSSEATPASLQIFLPADKAAFPGNQACIYALLTSPGDQVSVNGDRVVGGIRILSHKDEVATESQRWFLSTQSTPVVEVYQSDAESRDPRCPICRMVIAAGQQVVRCPECHRIFHQMDATADSPVKPCWTYMEQCKFCHHPTSLKGESLWHPQQEALQ